MCLVILKTNVNGTVHSDAGKGNFVMLSKINASSSSECGVHVISYVMLDNPITLQLKIPFRKYSLNPATTINKPQTQHSRIIQGLLTLKG
jgi:hypothetical protein